MKRTILCLMIGLSLMGTSTAIAGDNLANVVWNSSVYLGNEGGTSYFAQQLDLDIGLTKYYLTVNGTVTVNIGGSIPCTGTGFTTASNDFFLGMQCGILTINAYIDGQNLNGIIDVYQGDTDISTGDMTFVGMY
jgi:hypothetical protein